MFLFGAWHKTGIYLTNNLMSRIFNTLGASFHEDMCCGDVICLVTAWGCCDEVKANVQGRQGTTQNDTKLFEELATHRGLERRIVLSVRDPLEVVVSSYCYHNAGNERGMTRFHPLDIEKLDAKEGVPAQAEYMLPIMEQMLQVVQGLTTDKLVLKFEEFTNSSAEFDAQIDKMLDFFFQGLITPAEREALVEEARCEDLNRDRSHCESNPGILDDEGHDSDPNCKDEARAALDVIPAEMRARFEEIRTALGYQ